MKRQQWRCMTLVLIILAAISTKSANSAPVKQQSPAPRPQAASVKPEAALDELPSAQSIASDPLIQKAIEYYNSGNLTQAIPLFVQDLKANPDNGTAHYYLGLALKKIGQDANAINELETAVKVCPAGLTQTLAEQALHAGLAPEKKAEAPPVWSSLMAAATGNLFGVETIPTARGVSIKPPDLAGPLSDTIKNGKRWLKNGGPPAESSHRVGGSRPYSVAADVMSLGDLMELANQSRSIDARWRSNPNGVVRYSQAPEFTPDWDHWILVFRKAFNRQLFRHLGKNYRDEKGGMASVIFSLDKEGHLRGCIYESTADDIVNQCLVETVREMNGTYILAFPPTSHVTGWNFRMNWNFARALAYIKASRERQAIAEAKARILTTEAKLKQKSLEAAQKAKAEKLAQLPDKKTAAKIVPSLQVRQKVSALLMPKAKPLELKAVPMKLTDLPAAAPPLKPEPEASRSLTLQDIQDDNMDVSDLFK